MFSFGRGGSSAKDSDAAKEAEELLKAVEESSKENGDEKKEKFGGFDPTGLERAAKAARELQSLKYAGEAIEIAKTLETTKQMSSQQKTEEARVQQKAMEAEKVRIAEQERRQTIDKEAQVRQQSAYYQDQLSRKRHEDQLNSQRAMRDEDLRKQEESQMRIESLRRQTAEYEANIRKQTEQARVEAESKGKIKQERENWDLHLQRTRLEQREFRTTVLQGIKEAGKILGDGFRTYINDKEKLATTVGAISLAALGIYTAKVSTGVAGRLLEARLAQPPLVRETSRVSFLNLLRHPLSTLKSVFRSKGSSEDVMKDIVLDPKLHERLSKFVSATNNTVRNKSPFRNMLLYGPPGTGKTLFAKSLAQKVNLNYAIMTGSDILPLGKNSVNEIHKMFDWAEKSRKGLVLFVDEAETFLRKRDGSTDMSEESRNALNAFLYRTGTLSNKFMVVFATNQPDQLDWAINDRTDEIVEFGLPSKDERLKILSLYFDKLIVNGHKQSAGMFGGPSEITLPEKEELGETFFADIAAKTEGFSGRELNKMIISWQATARGNLDCALTKKEMLEILNQKIAQHKQKQVWDTTHN